MCPANSSHPAMVLFPTSYDTRDIAGRLQVKLGVALASNATDVLSPTQVRCEPCGATKREALRLLKKSGGFVGQAISLMKNE